MAQNLYDLGDEQQELDADWKKRQDRRAKILPISLLAVAVMLGAGLILLLRAILPDTAEGKAPPSARAGAPIAIQQDFAACDDPRGSACVLSANRFVWRGETYHLADAIVPNGDSPRCPAEAQLAAQGRRMLLSMMNGGAFELRRDPSDSDAHARILTRDGMSLGQILILKGLARPWSKQTPDWCGPPQDGIRQP